MTRFFPESISGYQFPEMDDFLMNGAPLYSKNAPFGGPVQRPPLTWGQFPGLLGVPAGDDAPGLPWRTSELLREPCRGLDHTRPWTPQLGLRQAQPGFE